MNKITKYEFRKVTNNDVEDMLTWKYEGIYSFFDNNFSEGKINYVKSFPTDDNVYAIYNDNNELIGNCAFYLKDKVSFSIQMRPSLTSKGMGKEFLQAILEFAKERYDLKNIELSVLKFNERAIRLYKSLDFKVINEFIGKTVKGEMEFITMSKEL